MTLNKIRKRDGRIVDFDSGRIRDAIHRAFIAVELGNGEKAEEVANEVVKLLEEKFKYEIPSVEDAQDLVIKVLKNKGYEKVAEEYQVYRERKNEIRSLREKLGFLEPKLTVNALEVLKSRYLLRNEFGEVIETPDQMFMRVAKAISKVDAMYGEDLKKSEKIFYNMMAKLEFLPNSPTLFNAGTSLGQLSACFVLPIEDSLKSIFKAVMDMALIEQSGGGVGFDFSKLRPKGDIVKSTAGVASGPVSFMRVFDVATDVIKAGGRRRGAMMGILRVDHPDIIEFIIVKQTSGILSNFNISVAITDEFMDKLEKDEEYWLINPRNKEKVKKLKARKIWDLIIESAWKSGDPGIIFIDEVNRHNPTPEAGKIEATNPCLPSYAWIMTEQGPKQVSDLINKKFIAIVNGERWSSSFEGFFQTGVKPIYKLLTKEGFELYLTKNHLVMKVKEEANGIKFKWVKAENLRKGDKILLNSHASIDFWEGLYSFEEGYFTASLITANNFKNECTFSDEIQLSNSCMLESCITINLIEKASSRFCKGLIAGLFDANSFIKKGKERFIIGFTQTNVELLKAIQRMLLRLGIYSKIRFKKNNKTLKNSITKPNYELVIYSKESILHFIQKIDFKDLKKKRKIQNLIKNCEKLEVKEHFTATFEKLIFNSVEPTYDVKIPGLNAFDANGFYVHNCGEQPLLPYESCNLGSINLSRMVENKEINWNKLKETVRNAVHFLDNVIDANIYPLKEIEEVTKANRKIGLGVMGFADMLIKLEVPYNSKTALNIAEKIMKFITDTAREKSMELGEERGSFPNFEKSIWKNEYSAMRNATVTTIAPTGSISIIAGCSSGIEPLFAISFIRNVLGGKRLFEINPLFELIAKQKGFYNAKLLEEVAKTGSVQKITEVPKEVKKNFVTALDISPEWHIKMQAAFQKYTDNAVSKTVNLPYDASVNDVKKIFELAWKLKCKGVTIFRYGSKPEQVLYVGKVKAKKKKFIAAEAEYAGGCPTKTCPFP
ncbi:ribonucleotide reductase [Candidatus Bathyarchaeota archaeon]|nr:ribonucleotide reductase [Candidatus Bathyarchaeota archaeon]